MNREQYENGVIEVMNTAHMDGETSVYGLEIVEAMTKQIAEARSGKLRYRAANKVLSFFGVKKPLEQSLTGSASGKLYPSLRRLEERGIIESHWGEATGVAIPRPRRFYQLAISPDDEPVSSMLRASESNQ